jgi:hypothetical protein
VLRDSGSSASSSSRFPDKYLRQGEGRNLRQRTSQAKTLKLHPVNRYVGYMPGETKVQHR